MEQHRAEAQRMLNEELTQGIPTMIFVAVDEATLCGFIEATIKPLDGFKSWPVAYIEGWYVDEAYRLRGIGRQLVRAVEQWAVSRGCSEIGSGCEKENRTSHAAHLRLGFQPIDDLIFLRKSIAAAPLTDKLRRVDWIELLAEPLRIQDAMTFVVDPSAGGIDVFLGTTRAERSEEGRDLVALEYEAYAEMALKQLHELARRARSKWPVVKLAILHRIGRVAVGEPSVMIGLSTPHRADAFAACQWLIDALKVEAAIWKKEIWADGSSAWVHPEP